MARVKITAAARMIEPRSFKLGSVKREMAGMVGVGILLEFDGWSCVHAVDSTGGVNARCIARRLARARRRQAMPRPDAAIAPMATTSQMRKPAASMRDS